ncbi:MAG: DUF188 domain-containing protein [Acutalibacteraceae bacterium]
MKILIDADGCPVVRLTISVAKEYGIQAVIFCDTSHEFHEDGVKTVTVDKGADSADFKIVNSLDSGDLVITQDYGLAAMVLSKNAKALTQNGLEITSLNIDSLLASRYAAKKARMSKKHLKGPPKRTAEQDKAFEKALRRILSTFREL